MTENSRHPVDELLPKGQLFAYGLQHVLAMYAGAVAVPLIIAKALDLSKDQLIYLINADLFAAGLVTLIQSLGFLNMGIRMPIMQGVTFAAVAPMVLIGQSHGLTSIFGATIAAGIVTYLISPYFSRLLRYFPPVVTGSIITIIGISLMPVAINWAAGGIPNSPDYASLKYISLAFAVLLFIVVLFRFLKGFWSNIAVLLGLIAGTLVSIPLGLTDFSQVSEASWLGLTVPFAFGFPTFQISSIVAMVVVMLVSMTETTGDIIAIGEIVDKPISRNDLTRGLRADGFGTFLGGIFNTFAYTAFAQNVGLVGLTGIKSRYVTAASGVILILLGLFPKMAAIVAAIPNPVLGGAGIAMFGMVAASGVSSLSKVQFEGNQNKLIVAISIGVGVITIGCPNFYHDFPEWARIVLHSGITAGSLVAIVLNYFFNELGNQDKTVAPEGTHNAQA